MPEGKWYEDLFETDGEDDDDPVEEADPAPAAAPAPAKKTGRLRRLFGA